MLGKGKKNQLPFVHVLRKMYLQSQGALTIYLSGSDCCQNVKDLYGTKVQEYCWVRMLQKILG